MKIGYARVSSNNQDLELQKDALLKFGCDKLFSESVSGKNNNRTQLIEMINSLREKDIVVVYKIDRIARSLKGLIEIIERTHPLTCKFKCYITGYINELFSKLLCFPKSVHALLTRV